MASRRRRRDSILPVGSSWSRISGGSFVIWSAHLVQQQRSCCDQCLPVFEHGFDLRDHRVVRVERLDASPRLVTSATACVKLVNDATVAEANRGSCIHGCARAANRC